jgi:hypothetical protein
MSVCFIFLPFNFRVPFNSTITYPFITFTMRCTFSVSIAVNVGSFENINKYGILRTMAYNNNIIYQKFTE